MKAKSTTYVIGIDLGGTKIRAGIFRSGDYKLIQKIQARTGLKASKKTILSEIERLIARLIKKNTVFIGIGMAGIVDAERGVFVSGPNLPASFRNIPLARRIQRVFGIRTRIENDARCFALAEALGGAGRGCDSVFGLTLGTGIGGGLFREGGLVRGRMAAGEIGHLPVADELPGHDASKVVDLEHVASGRGLERTYAALSGKSLSGEEIEKRFHAGDPHAKKAFELGRHALTKGLAAAQLLFDPDRIVIGGGLGRCDAYWKPAVRKARALAFPSLKRMDVKSAKLGADSGMYGAARLYEL